MFISYINCLYCFDYIKRPYLIGPLNFLREGLIKESAIALIAQEEYFDILKQNGIGNIKEYPISIQFEKRYIKRFNSAREAWVALLKEEQNEYVNFLEETIEKITNEYKDEIEGVLTYLHCPSLHKVCKSRNIKIFEYETSPIRLPFYKFTLGYFTNHNKYCSEETRIRYKNFLNELSIGTYARLSRKEILALVLSNENMNILYNYNDYIEYDIALPLTINDDCYTDVWACENNKTLIEKASTIFGNSLLIRPHPWDVDSFEKYNFDIDNSTNSLQFLKRCKKVATIASNVGFEAMLLGKPTYILSDIAFSFEAMKDLDVDDDEVCGIDYINFITFCYFTPHELMNDTEYIRWRLTSPSELEIYNYNINYIITKILKLNNDIIEDRKGRLNRILVARGLQPFHYDKKIVSITEDEIWVKKQLALRDKEIFDLEVKLAEYRLGENYL